MSLNIKKFSTQLFLFHNEYRKLWGKIAAKHNMYSGQERVFFALVDYHDGATLNEISKITGIGVSSLSVSISNMEKSGDIKKEVDANDKRVYRIYLTPEGFAKFDGFTSSVDMIFQKFTDKYQAVGGSSQKFLEDLIHLTEFVTDEQTKV